MRNSAPNSRSGPGVLLVTANRWALAARLASGFLNLGCRVAAVGATTGHPISKVRGFKFLYPYAALDPLASVRTAIQSFAPEIVIPICDRSVQHLHELHAQCSSEGATGSQIRELIERSLGPADSFSTVSTRYDLLMLAKDANIPVPDTIPVRSAEDLDRWKCSLPFLLKADGTFCGMGVRTAETLSRGKRCLRELRNGTTLFQLVKRLLMFQDRAWTISNWARSRRPRIIAQAIVLGRPANCSVVCWKGELLAGIAVEVLETAGPCQPAVLVQVVEGREMLEAARQIAHRLQLTGFFGLDFMIEHGTAIPYLIEMNPRCTPPCSVNLGAGRDLLGAMWAKLAKQKLPEREPITEKKRIAYFPQAAQRSADSTDFSPLDSAYLDVPIGEPELVKELLCPWSQRSLAGWLLDTLRRRSSAKHALAPHISKVLQLQQAGNAGAEALPVREGELRQFCRN